MKVYTYNGKILQSGGKVANSENCCCDEQQTPYYIQTNQSQQAYNNYDWFEEYVDFVSSDSDSAN